MGGSCGWHTFSSLFLSSCESSETFRIRIPLDPSLPAIPDVRPGDAVGATFRDGKRKCIFSVPFISSSCHETGVEVVLGWPAAVHHLRRRAFTRVEPPRTSSITVRLRPFDGRGSTVLTPELSVARLLDISVGGLRLAVADTRVLEPGKTYRCSFTPRAGRMAIAFDTIVLHCGRDDEGRAVVGLRIVGLETEQDGSRALDRLARVVEYFQRAASRRKG